MINQQQIKTIKNKPKTIFSISSRKSKQDKFSPSHQIIFQSDKNENLEKNISLLKLFSNKTQFIYPKNFKIIQEINKKGKTCSFTIKNNIFSMKNTKTNYNLSNKTNLFDSIPWINKIKKNKILKNINSSREFNESKRENLIDLIHDKEIKICQDLIKSFPENGRNRGKRLNKNNIFKNEVTDGLVKSIKFFNIDNINNQRIIEHQILNNNDYIPKSLSEYNNFKNATLLSISTNYKTKNFPKDIHKFNINNYNDLNSSFNTIKNNSDLSKNINNSKILNLNSSKNDTFTKSKMTKTKININNIINNSIRKNFDKYKRSEINFSTGFVRKQKNINGDVFTSYLKNKEKFEINIKNNMKKRKKESNKLSLPEIQEYKLIIKGINKGKSNTLRKSKSEFDFNNKEKIESDLKDRLIDELSKIYFNQKNMFLSYLKNNISNRKLFAESYKNKVNQNIENINKIKREQNFYIDGYSLLDGNINKKLKQYNYILGNKFHDKEQKMGKIDKLMKITKEYENNIKNYENAIFKETNSYNQLFIPKFKFNNYNKENKQNNSEIDLSKHNKSNQNISLDSSIIFKVDNRNLSLNSNKEEKIYKDYINFRKEYRKKYSFD